MIYSKILDTGVKYISDSVSELKSLENLSLVLISNNITAAGTEHLGNLMGQ